jgi:ATP-binding cassette, subfamily B, multidrug efflux pump
MMMRGMASMQPGKSKRFSETLKRLLLSLRPDWPRIALVLLLACTSIAFLVLGPKLLGNATDVIFNGVIGKQLPAGVSKQQAIAQLRSQGQNQLASLVSGMDVQPGNGVDFANLAHILGLAVFVYLTGSAFQWLQSYLMAGVAQRTVYRMRRDVETKLTRLPLRYFDSHPHGDILSRVTNDIDNLSTTLQQGLSQLLTSLLTVVGVLTIMFWISPLLAFISLLTVPLAVLITTVIARRAQSEFMTQWRSTGVLNGHVEEMYTGHALLQLFGQRSRAIAEFDRQNEELFRVSFRAQFLTGMIQPAMQLLANLNYVAIAAIGGYRVVSGAISLGAVIAFIQYSRQFTQPITQVASQMNLLQSGIASAERVFELLDAEEEEPDTLAPQQVHAPSGRVALDHVSFGYNPGEPLISDFNLAVEPGETVAIVGPTGAGKTTVVNLLMRFYEIDGGRIRIDGVDTKQMTREAVRRLFGMVLQDTWLFAGTIRANIAYGREGASEREIIAAAEAAYVDHFVRTLPDGYDALLDEDATNISAGQRQLLTIARAFLANPPILILDEATSSVDTRTEVLIQDAMARLRQGKTSFMIAHRLSTIRNADTIVVMDTGRIVEQGNHAALMARRGFYYTLYTSQFTEAFVGER